MNGQRTMASRNSFHWSGVTGLGQAAKCEREKLLFVNALEKCIGLAVTK